MADKPRILIVDDDEDYRASMRAMLEYDGYEVIEASTGKEGREKAHTERPDLIVLDIMMESPVEGYSVVQALKFAGGEQEAEIPIIVVSSVREDPSTLFPMAGEMPMVSPDEFLPKPVDMPRFLQTVRNMLGQ